MHYYKVINGKDFVGIGTTGELRRFQKKHRIFLGCDEEQAQYIQCGSELYHANWMKPEIIENSPYLTLEVIEIDKEEYEVLFDAVESGEEIEIEPDNPIPDEPIIDEDVTVEFVREQKINAMSVTCLNVITAGFDIILSDGEQHHFSLTTQDQLNLITLSTFVASGATEIPYHADDEVCKYYSVEDISAITNMATFFKTYHVSYFNSLKLYIESLNDMKEISSITYGFNIPEEYQSDVLKNLNKQKSEVI